MSVRTIRLYGELGERFGRVWRLDVQSPAEAVRALCSQAPGFRKYLQAHAQAGYRVLCDTLARDRETLALPTSARTIRIVPAVQGAGKNGVLNVIVGAVLIWASGGFAAFGYGGLAAGATGAAAAGWGVVGAIGTSLVMSGVSQMLTKPVSSSKDSVERPENRPSYAFDGAVNTAAQGNPVPVCYGEMIVGSQVVSAGLTTEQVTP